MQNIASYIVIIVSIVTLIEILLYTWYSVHEVFADSPSFPRHEIKESPHNWIDLLRRKHTNVGSNYTDIRAVDYFSDGTTLNSTVWLASSFMSKPIGSDVSYGMLIDADSNKETGLQGVDYQIEMRWENKTKTWTKIFEEWSSFGDRRIIYEKDNYSGFFGNHAGYVVLNSDLKSLGFPNQYNVIFYALEQKGNSSFSGTFTNWTAIPSPTLSLSILPNSITFRPGEEKQAEILINSTAKFGTYANIFSRSSSNMQSAIIPNRLYIPAHSTATSTLHIKIPQNGTAGQYTLPISANFTTAPDQFYRNIESHCNSIKFLCLPPIVGTENTPEPTNLVLLVLPPLTFSGLLSATLTKYAIITGFLPLIITTIVASRLSKLIDLKKSVILENMTISDLYQINATVIIGVLIFLTLGGSNNTSSGMTKAPLLIGIMTASIVFPFALSVIRVAVKGAIEFGIKLTITGFVYLMVTVILLAFIL